MAGTQRDVALRSTRRTRACILRGASVSLREETRAVARGLNPSESARSLEVLLINLFFHASRRRCLAQTNASLPIRIDIAQALWKPATLTQAGGVKTALAPQQTKRPEWRHAWSEEAHLCNLMLGPQPVSCSRVSHDLPTLSLRFRPVVAICWETTLTSEVCIASKHMVKSA